MITHKNTKYSWEDVYKISGLCAEDFTHDPTGSWAHFTKCVEPVFTTTAPVDNTGCVYPTFNIGDGYTSGFLKYFSKFRGKKIEITVKVLAD